MVISTDTNGFLWLLLFLSCMTLQLESSIKCPPFFPCGDLGNISFPFTTKSHPECGALVIYGCDDDYAPGARKSILNNDRWFDIVTLNQSSITVRDDRLLYLLLSRSCDVLGYNSTFWVNSPLASSQLMRSAYVLRCDNPLTLNSKLSEILSNHTLCGSHTFYEVVARIQESDYLTLVTYYSSYYNLTGCTLIQLPFLGPIIANGFISDLVNYSLAADISIQITLSPNCSDCRTVYGGQCRIDNYGKFFCDKGETGGRKIVLIAVCSAAAGALGVLILLGWCFRRCFCSKAKPSEEIIEMFLKDHGHLAAKKYSYLEVKKATNSFKDKIGQGGYGSVYKGKLSDGTFVAVKVLSESKGDGEEFINEVASISVTSHVNIVQLLGFCLEGSKRALIYKYMPNGSVEKFIYKDKDPLKFSPQLSCKTMYKIAIGVARGLDYLHKGCNSKIVHFDIKPHNILLDEDFCPKISDFGLAKICTRKDSILSLLDARGTIGYIAPEVFSRNFGGVSHKSDVYSYGMMVLEIIGGRKNINIKEETDVERSSEVYFPHWIYKRLKVHEDLGLRCIKNELDKEMIHKMIIVSLWCIQTDPTNRPTMSKVVDMMESNLESLQMPPKPYLSSPPTSPARLLSDSSYSDM